MSARLRGLGALLLALALWPAAGAAQGIAPPDDPYYTGTGSWGQDYDDQWAIKRVGLTAGADSAWALVDAGAAPVVVAVIDTGLDWNHLDISWNNIWTNPGEKPDNGVDDDKNGFVDDIIGWNFYGDNNKPWDHDGHGTFVTGVIAATWGNGAGLAGINPKARIMVLKALNNFGHSRASYLASALVYAADNGARVINMSVGGKGLTRIEREAVAYAHSRGAVIVVAAGNEGIDVEDFGIAGLDEVIAVAATDFDDRRARFSNWGKAIDIAGPGLDVLGPRARRTDLMEGIPGVEYTARGAYVGDDKRYYRASGTSFSAPIVTGIASLVLVNRPKLTNVEVRRILLNSARDIETPGIDQYTGHGLVDARAALAADKDFFILTAISGAQPVQIDNRLKVQVNGTVDADDLHRAWIEIGAGDDPGEWKKVVTDFREAVRDGVLGHIDAAQFSGSPVWTLRLRAEHRNGRTGEARYRLSLE